MFKNKLGLSSKIFLGLVLGVISGVFLYQLPSSAFKDTLLLGGIIEFIGEVFLRLLRMLLVPVVLFSLIVGASSVVDIKQFRRIGGKTIFFYLITTAFAISIAVGVGLMMNPGTGLDLSSVYQVEPTINEAVPFVKVLIDIFPTNPFDALINAKMLQIIFFALFIGLSLSILGDKVATIKKACNQLNDLFLKMVMIIMAIAPYGVFALTTKTFAALGYQAMLPVGKYMLTFLLGLILHVGIVYVLLLTWLGKVNPVQFLKRVSPALPIAFSTASSAAALPIILNTVEKRVGVSNKVASFTLPLGNTINMDGTAIMQGIATIFIAQVFGVALSITDILLIILTATLASIGTAAVPGSGLIMLTMVLTAVGLPLEGIALVIGVDRVLDMCRTAVNITGDAVVALVIAKQENEFDEEIFYDRKMTSNSLEMKMDA